MGKIYSGTAAVAELDREDDLYVDQRRAPLRTTLHIERDAESRPDPMPALTPINMNNEDFTYERPNSMHAPPPRPGYVQRWVRAPVTGAPDPTNNWLNRMHEGWVPRPISTMPEEYRHLRSSAQGIDCAQMGSSVLCEKPIQKQMAKEKFVRDLTRRVHQGIGVAINEASDRRLPLVREEEETASVPRGRRPATMVN